MIDIRPVFTSKELFEYCLAFAWCHFSLGLFITNQHAPYVGSVSPETVSGQQDPPKQFQGSPVTLYIVIHSFHCSENKYSENFTVRFSLLNSFLHSGYVILL